MYILHMAIGGGREGGREGERETERERERERERDCKYIYSTCEQALQASSQTNFVSFLSPSWYLFCVCSGHSRPIISLAIRGRVL